MSEAFRLNKFISESGICSRREADKFIEHGHVLVNGKKASVGDRVTNRDKVIVNGQLIEHQSEKELVLIALNKPTGIVSTTEIGSKDNIIDFVGFHERIFPIGRLDKDSQGLIFLTNNGDLVNKILRAGNKHEKEYLVTVNKPIKDEFLIKMSAGVPILGEMTKKCKIYKESTYTFRIILIQGLNRQIRRMCEYFDYQVVKLERIRIMSIGLKGLSLGEWRLLEDDEINSILKAVSTSVSSSKEQKKTPTSSSHVNHQKPRKNNNVSSSKENRKSTKTNQQSKNDSRRNNTPRKQNSTTSRHKRR